MSLYKDLKIEIDKGLSGQSGTIPISLNRVNSFIEISKGTMYVIGGETGCLAYGTKVLMYDGTFKEVQDVVIGDQLMGVDSTPRNVLALRRGQQQMYCVRQNRGIDYRVNEDHILHLKNSKGEHLNIRLGDYLNNPDEQWKGCKGMGNTHLSDIYIETDLIDDYYGFLLDGDHLFMLEDFTITHNSGKSSFAIEEFITQPLLWDITNNADGKIKLDIIYFSMERKQFMNTAKMISRLNYETHGILIPVKKMLGRSGTMSDYEKQFVEESEGLLAEFDKRLYVREGVVEHEEMYNFIHEFAKKHGELRKMKDDRGREIIKYIPHHPNHIVLIIGDHIGLVGDDKGDIDNYSKLMRKSRDVYGFSPVIVQQLNREISSTSRSHPKNKPKLSDFAGTSNVTHDADVVLAIYDPFRHIPFVDSDKTVQDCCGYELNKLVDGENKKYYRSVHILKNTYDGEGVAAGLAFHPFTGMFKTLPRVNEITDKDYEDVITGRYFTDATGSLF